MLSSDAWRLRAAEKSAANAPHGAARNSSRIITAERLVGYTPFRLHSLIGADAGGPDMADAATPRSNDDARPEEPQAHGSEHDAARKAGLAAGFQQGFDAGTAHADAEHRKAEQQAGATLSDRIETLSATLQQRFEQVERDAADDVVALALEVARQALRATLSVRPEVIVPIVQEALAHLFDEQLRVRLHMNPADVALVREELGDRLATNSCEIVRDASISLGGCRIETPRSSIDATLETRWRRTLAAIGRSEDGSLAQTAEPSA